MEQPLSWEAWVWATLSRVSSLARVAWTGVLRMRRNLSVLRMFLLGKEGKLWILFEWIWPSFLTFRNISWNLLFWVIQFKQWILISVTNQLYFLYFVQKARHQDSECQKQEDDGQVFINFQLKMNFWESFSWQKVDSFPDLYWAVLSIPGRRPASYLSSVPTGKQTCQAFASHW